MNPASFSQQGPLNLDDFDLKFSGPGLAWNFILWPEFSGNDVGKTFYATSATHANFNTAAALLTDGVDRMFSAGVWWPPDSSGGRTGSGAIFDESEVVKTVSSYPDFIGYNIGTIAITVDRFDYTYPGDTFAPGWHELNIAVTVSFYIQVIPEPSTLLLVGVGIVLLRKREH
jgi:hypothetical protein